MRSWSGQGLGIKSSEMTHDLLPLFFASGARTVNLTPADLRKIAGAVTDGPIFYAVMAALFPALLGPILQELYEGFPRTHATDPGQQRDHRNRGYAVAVGVLLGLLGTVLSLIWRNNQLRLDWRAVIVCSAFLALLLIVAARAVTSTRNARPVEADSTSPPVGGHTKHASTRLRVAMSHGAGLFFGMVVGASLFLLLGPTSPTKARVGTVYHVYGTCAAGAGHTCGLNERRRPTTHSEPRGQLRDGVGVAVVCQTVGEKQTNSNGVSTDIWDKLDTGAYVTDLYVDTPQIGTGIPVCLIEGQAPATTR